MNRLAKHAGLVIFLLALAPRLAWVFYRHSVDHGATAFPDEDLHWQLASNLVERGELVSDDGRYAARMPGYPLFLALFAWVGENGRLLARIAQALIGAGTAWLACRELRSVAGNRAAWLGGVFIAADPFNIYFCNLLLTEVVFTLVAVWFVFVVARFLRTIWPTSSQSQETTDPPPVINRELHIAFALLSVALLFLRPSAAGWIALVWLLFVILTFRDRRFLIAVGAATLAMIVALLPWGIRNQQVLGASALLSANGGVTLYDAQGPQADGSSNQLYMGEMTELAGMNEIERDRYLQRRAIEEMRADPARVAKLAVKKFARTWNPYPNFGPARQSIAADVGAAYTFAVLAGFAPMVLGFKRFRALFFALLIPIIYFTLLHMIYIGSVRYRIPLMPMLAISLALGPVLRQKQNPPRQAGG